MSLIQLNFLLKYKKINEHKDAKKFMIAKFHKCVYVLASIKNISQKPFETRRPN